MKDWQFLNEVTLNGQRFEKSQYAQSFREQPGYAMIDGEKQLFWLYDTYTYHDGKGHIIIHEAVPRWVEKMGYVIDLEEIEYESDLSESDSDELRPLTILMKQRRCDVAVCFVKHEEYYLSDYEAEVVILSYDKEADSYFVYIYNCMK